MFLDHPAPVETRVAERGPVDPDTFLREILPVYRPVLLRGQVAHWPAVAAGREGVRSIADYLIGFAGGQPMEVLIGPPEINGRYFYRDDMSGFNFHRQKVPLPAFLGELVRFVEDGTEKPHSLYANAATAPEHMPGWAEANPMNLPAEGATPRLWIGNATQVATHYDQSPNLAAVVAGRRRFTLFPPEQLKNLYIGPLDRTLAGPPVSMVDPDAPDLERYPRFAEALQHAQVAEMEPGDVLFIPPIWWHHVRAFDQLNVMVNFWSAHDPAASPFVAMVNAVMSVRDLPADQKAAWRSWFDHLVFDDDAPRAADHLPPAARGPLGPPSPARDQAIRGFIQAKLSGRG